MRIPTYQTQVNLKRVMVRPVQLATPVLESSQDKKWKQLGEIGQTLLFIRENGLRAKRKVAESENRRKQEASAPPQQKEGNYPEFSSPMRGALLNFSRGIFEAKEKGSSITQQSTPLAQFDNYFVQHAAENLPDLQIETPDQHLLVQDYAILRKELQQVQEKQLAQQRQDQFNQGVNHFVEVAGLIRNPAAMELYIGSNLTRAEEESKLLGESAPQWQAQKQGLYNAVLEHNITTALQVGEVKQAREMYEHFEKHLSPAKKDLLQAQVTQAEIDGYATQLAGQAYGTCVSDGREIKQEKLKNFAEQHVQDTGFSGEQLQVSLQRKLQEQIRQQYRQEAQICRQLLDGTGSVWKMPFGTVGQFAETEKLVRDMQAQPQMTTEPEVFNALYELTQSSQILPADIEKAYEEKKISARDALCLTEHCCRVQAGEKNPREVLLSYAVDELCRRENLTQEQAEQARYFVFSSGYDTEKHLAAAQELKQILTLQEKKK